MMQLNQGDVSVENIVLIELNVSLESSRGLLRQRKNNLLKIDDHHQVPKVFNYTSILLEISLLLTIVAVAKCNWLLITTQRSGPVEHAPPDKLVAEDSDRASYFLDQDANQSTSATRDDQFYDNPPAEEQEDDDEKAWAEKKAHNSLPSKREQANQGDEIDYTQEPEFNGAADEQGDENPKKFEDFDDFEALNLGQFYSQDLQSGDDLPDNKTRQSIIEQFYDDKETLPSINVKKKTFKTKHKQRGHIEKSATGRTKMRDTEAQQQRQPAPIVAPRPQSECAMQRDSGECITYHMVEWAIGEAKRALNVPAPIDPESTDDDADGEFDDEADSPQQRLDRELNSLEPSESIINSIGELNEWTTRMLARRFNLSPEEINFDLEQIDVRRTSLWQSCPRIYRQPLARTCLAATSLFNSPPGRNGDQMSGLLQQRYRSHTGQCNNLLEPRLGSSYMPFVRMLEPDYADAVGWPRRSASGSSLPPARLVALSLHPDLDSPADDHSMLFVNWGQLINHDLAMASNARDSTGHEHSCCRHKPPTAVGRNSPLDDVAQRVCMPIELAAHDPVYGPVGRRCHDFKRSLAALRPGCSLGPRTQLNTISSYVDASFVYGSTNSVSVSLRSRADGAIAAGQLAMWNYFANSDDDDGSNNNNRVSGGPLKPLLPPQRVAPDAECVGRRRGLYCFRSGDARTNQQIPLVALHTVHTRNHNRLASGLRALNPHWSAGRIYEEARHIHIAQVQHILLGEYLPLLLGDKLCKQFELVESPANEYWDHYDASLNAGVSQEFAAAAFRQGHSSVPGHVFRFDPRTRQPSRVYPLRATYLQPWPLFEPGALDEFLVGLSEAAAQSVDPFVSAELSGHLLEAPGERVGLDLIAINIQRGRDQGVASYNVFREFCGLERLNSFAQLEGLMSNRSAQLMSQLYETVDDIDLFSGGLSEFPAAGARVGPTFGCIIGRQFQTLRAADRFWFESSAGAHAFTPDQLNSIKQFSLARLICSNSDRIELIQARAMRQPHPILNPLQDCASLPDLELALWLDLQPAPAQLVVAQPSNGTATLAAAPATAPSNVTSPRTGTSRVEAEQTRAAENEHEDAEEEDDDDGEHESAVGDTEMEARDGPSE